MDEFLGDIQSEITNTRNAYENDGASFEWAVIHFLWIIAMALVAMLKKMP